VKRNEDSLDGILVENESNNANSAAAVLVQSPIKSYFAVRAVGASSDGWSFGTDATNYALEMKYGDDFFSTQPPVSIAEPTGSFYPGLSATTSALRIDDEGRVGVGTDSPTAALHVQRDGDGLANMKVENVNAGTNAHAGVKIVSQQNAYVAYAANSNQWSHGVTNDGTFRVKANSGNFATADSSALVVQVDGDVGIGVEAPQEALHVQRDADATIGARVQNVNNNSNAKTRLLVESQANEAYVGVGVSGTGWSMGTDATGTLLTKPRLDFTLPISTPSQSYLPVSIAQPGGAGYPDIPVAHAALSINSSGRVGIGINSPTTALHVQGDSNALAAITVENVNVGTDAHAGLKIVSGKNAYVTYIANNGYQWSNGVSAIDGKFMIKPNNGNFDPGGSSHLAIKYGDGNVGMGIEAPTAALHVRRIATAAAIIVESTFTNVGGTASLAILSEKGAPFIRLQTRSATPGNVDVTMGLDRNTGDFHMTATDNFDTTEPLLTVDPTTKLTTMVGNAMQTIVARAEGGKGVTASLVKVTFADLDPNNPDQAPHVAGLFKPSGAYDTYVVQHNGLYLVTILIELNLVCVDCKLDLVVCGVTTKVPVDKKRFSFSSVALCSKSDEIYGNIKQDAGTYDKTVDPTSKLTVHMVHPL
jgi:hypothetical protein